MPPLVLTAVNVAARLTDGAEHTVALDSFPHVRAARVAWLASHGTRPVGKGTVGARSARCRTRVVGCRSNSARRLLGAACRRIETRVCARAVEGIDQVGCGGIAALIAWKRSRRALRTVRPRPARLALRPPLGVLVFARLALGARAHACVGCERAGAAQRLLGTTYRRVEAHVGRCALGSAREIRSCGVRALLAGQRRAGARWTVRPLLAWLAHLLARVFLERASVASITEGRTGSGCHEAGRASSTVVRVGAARDWIGLPRSAGLACRASALASVWIV